jgi:hypothetical protein
MIKFSESLMLELDMQLRNIHSETVNPIEYAEAAIKVLIPALEKLKAYFLKYKFSNQIEEIIFFKDIKPKLASKLIYYNEVYNMATNKPVASKKSVRKFYATELDKLQRYFEENSEFYKYYRTGNRCLDNKYFIRDQHDIRLTLDSFYLQADHRFSTSHDYKVARILANDLMKQHIEKEMATLNTKTKTITATDEKKLHWTGSKVALIELIYALHAEAVFNGGNAELKETVTHFETMFNIELKQFHRTFLEIRSRKSERTKFLTTLKEKLILRMDDADEN